ncbi:hypothetical protein Gotur_009901, partial [Gossypium turneri]
YFLRKLKKVKKSNGQVLAINEIARLQSLGSDGSELKWIEGFNIGSVIEAKIGEAKDIVSVVIFSMGGLSLETRSVVQAAVLDVDKAERLVDLSLKSEFVEKSQEGSSKSQTHKKKRKREASKALELLQTVNAVVEIVKEHYLIFEKNPTKIKNYGIWLRYQSRTGYHNMYKEYRDTTLNGAVEQMYTEMASRHRVRFPCIQIIKTATIPAKLCKRDSTKQFHNSKIKFPLVFKKVRPPTRKLKTTYKASKPNLFM